jgi:hypothetical protein
MDARLQDGLRMGSALNDLASSERGDEDQDDDVASAIGVRAGGITASTVSPRGATRGSRLVRVYWREASGD